MGELWLVERDRWVLWLPVCFSLGIGAYFALTEEPSLRLGLALGGCGAALMLLAASLRQAMLLILVTPIAAAGCGFLAAEWRTIRVDSPILRRATGAIELSGRVLSIEVTKTGR